MTSGDRDEALAGDLLEALESGRSDGWYWRQAAGVCAVSWFESIRMRAPLLMFALLWSLVAPGWNAICTSVESNSVQDRFCSIFGGIWIIPALIAWTILHSIFLWGGLLLFGVFHRSVEGRIHPGKFKRAFLLAPAVFVPFYGAMMLMVSLYWFSFFEHYRLQASLLGQMIDLRTLADVIRIPYLFALVWALWGAVLKPDRAATATLPDLSIVSSTIDSEIVPPTSSFTQFIVRRFFTLMVGAGLMNSLIAGILLCRLPEAHSPTFVSLCMRALLYVLAGLLTGVGGTYLYWRNPASPFSIREPVPFPLFALLCAGGWVWVPAIVILSEQLSPATAFVAMIGAFVLASGLRRVSSSVQSTIPTPLALPAQSDANLFVETLHPAPLEMYGYVVAISLYAGTAELFVRSYFISTVFFVLAASVFAWEKILPHDQGFDRAREFKRAALRLARITIPAVLVTAWALLDGVAHRNRIEEARTGETLHSAESVKKNSADQTKRHVTPMGVGGYESVILWPYPDKRPIIPPIATRAALFVPGNKEPLIIRFNGPYWYFQAPDMSPGPGAHKAQGTPIGFDIQSSNSAPVVMDAHQYLASAIPIVCCREITVEIENWDNTAGAISLGVMLADATAPKRRAVYLGKQPILSTQPGHFSNKTRAVSETLHFPVPANSRVRKFNEITVLVLPDVEHALDAPRLAIRQFELYPRR